MLQIPFFLTNKWKKEYKTPNPNFFTEISDKEIELNNPPKFKFFLVKKRNTIENKFEKVNDLRDMEEFKFEEKEKKNCIKLIELKNFFTENKKV